MTIERNPPVLTAWKMEITHGMQQCEDGLYWGWGWACYACDPPIGIHGYQVDIDLFEGIQEHLLTCPGG